MSYDLACNQYNLSAQIKLQNSYYVKDKCLSTYLNFFLVHILKLFQCLYKRNARLVMNIYIEDKTDNDAL